MELGGPSKPPLGPEAERSSEWGIRVLDLLENWGKAIRLSQPQD